MIKRFLIATAKTVPAEKVESFLECLKDAAINAYSVKLIAMRAAHGPGCINLALKVEGDEAQAEEYAKAVTMVLMPSRYCDCGDDFDGFDLSIFNN